MKAKHNLRKEKRILESLLALRKPHRRMDYCTKPAPRVAKWWSRRQRKREAKRLERLAAKFKGTGPRKKLTQREIKQQRRKDVLSELSKEIKAQLPHFRMLYRAVHIGGPPADELQLRKHNKKRKILSLFKKEHNLLCSEIHFLISPSIAKESSEVIWRISKLTQEKMFWDHVFNDVKALLRLMTTKIAENGTELERMKLEMNKRYVERKNNEQVMVTQPAYFGEMEYFKYPEKRLHHRKSIKDRYLEDLAEIECLFMELEKKGEELTHYLRTRELFRCVLDKILNRLNRGKKIVLDFLQEGHNIMNELTMKIMDLMSMKRMMRDVVEQLEARKRFAQNERAIAIQETKDMMARHRPTVTSDTHQDILRTIEERPKPLEEVKEELNARYEVFLKALLVMGGLTDPGDLRIADYTELSKQKWIPETKQWIQTNGFLLQKITFPLIETYDYRKRCESMRKDIMEKKESRRQLRNQTRSHLERLQPILGAARRAKYRVRKEYFDLYRTWSYYLKPFRDLYALLHKRPAFRADKLGIHNRMTEFNKLECLDTLRDSIPGCVSQLIHSELYEGARNLPYTSVLRTSDRQRKKWQRYQLIRQLIRPQTDYIRKRKTYQIREHPPLYKSPCPLCTVEERLSKMAVVEEFEDQIRSVEEIRCELRDTQDCRDTQALNHQIWECSQPAARSLIQLLILEDRTRQPGKIMDFTKMAQ